MKCPYDNQDMFVLQFISKDKGFLWKCRECGWTSFGEDKKLETGKNEEEEFE